MTLSIRRFAILQILAVAMLSSCVDLSADIEIGEDGSGSMRLEYRVSRLVESMGKLEGEDRWLPFPYERASFERTLGGVRGLRLEEYSDRVDETDRAVRAVISFSDLDALARFVNTTGRSASLAENGPKRTLTLRLSEGGGPLDPDLKRLVDNVFRGYGLALRFRLPRAASIQGGSLEDEGTAVFSLPVNEVLSAEKPLLWTLSW